MITEKELTEKYYYKNDLVSLCKKMNVPHHGTKYELQERLLEFVKSGRKDTYKTKRKKTTLCPKEITLDTRFIENGLKFDQNLRNYISKQTGKNNIIFTKHMGHAVRKARRDGTDITVKELIDIFNTPKSGLEEIPEDKTYQWNNFVRDFTQSNESLKYNEKLKVASILWNEVRESHHEKIYRKELIVRYNNLIINYLKKEYK